MFTDDIVFLAELAEDLQKLINVVADFCGKWRIHLNVTKIKVTVYTAARGFHGQAQYMWKYAMSPWNKFSLTNTWEFGSVRISVGTVYYIDRGKNAR